MPKPKLTDRAYVRNYGIKLPAPSGHSHVSNCALTGLSNSLRASFSLVLKLAVSTSEVPPSLILQADTPLQLLPLSYFLIHKLLLSTFICFLLTSTMSDKSYVDQAKDAASAAGALLRLLMYSL